MTSLEFLFHRIRKQEQTCQESSVVRCPYCGSSNVIYDWQHGEYICRSCGTVIQERVVQASSYEFKSYDIDEYLRKQHYSPLRKCDLNLLKLRTLVSYYLRTIGLVDVKVGDEVLSKLLMLHGKYTLHELAISYVYIIAQQRGYNAGLRSFLKKLQSHVSRERAYMCVVELRRLLGIASTSAEVLERLLSRHAEAIAKYAPLKFVKNVAFELLKVRQSYPRCILAAATYIVAKALRRDVTQRDIARTCGCTDTALRNVLHLVKSAVLEVYGWTASNYVPESYYLTIGEIRKFMLDLLSNRKVDAILVTLEHLITLEPMHSFGIFLLGTDLPLDKLIDKIMEKIVQAYPCGRVYRIVELGLLYNIKHVDDLADYDPVRHVLYNGKKWFTPHDAVKAVEDGLDIRQAVTNKLGPGPYIMFESEFWILMPSSQALKREFKL